MWKVWTQTFWFFWVNEMSASFALMNTLWTWLPKAHTHHLESPNWLCTADVSVEKNLNPFYHGTHPHHGTTYTLPTHTHTLTPYTVTYIFPLNTVHWTTQHTFFHDNYNSHLHYKSTNTIMKRTDYTNMHKYTWFEGENHTATKIYNVQAWNEEAGRGQEETFKHNEITV
jgi:hypothetical protein